MLSQVPRHGSRVGRLLVGAAALALFLVLPQAVVAHPLGNVTTNRYSRLELLPDRILVRYVLDMAEIPTFQELPILDQDRNGRVDADELAAYAAQKVATLAGGLHLTVDGVQLKLQQDGEVEAALLPGQGGLQTLRLALWFEAPLPSGATGRVRHVLYRDGNYPERLGWKEIVVRGGGGSTILSSTAPTEDRSDELRAYPEDMLSSPLDRRDASITFRPGAGEAKTTGNAPPLSAPAAVSGRARNAFTELVTARELSAGVIAASLLAAMLWGAAHALSPGHGKTVVAAYLVGARGTLRHALFLGLTVTITHTAGVFALGLGTLFASRYILPDRLYPWLSVLSGLIVVGLGVWLCSVRWKGLRTGGPGGGRPAHDGTHAGLPVSSATPARPGPPLSLPPPAPAPHDGCAQTVQHATSLAQTDGWYELNHGTMPGHIHPLAPQSHEHVHLYAGAHFHMRHDHVHICHSRQVYGHERHDDRVACGMEGAFVHTHDGHAHSHLPPGMDGARVSWRSLLALGVSGGLLPCPSALVVLLGAIALHRTGFGLALVVAFSLGLAGVLTGIGVLFVYAGRLLERVPADALPGSRWILRATPLLSAGAITVAGLVLTARAVLQLGVLRL